MYHAINENRKKTNNESNRTTKSTKSQNARSKGNLFAYGNIGNGPSNKMR